MGFSAPSLKGRALRLLSQREHSRPELERKLKKYEEVPGTLAAALDELAAKDFINEARVVQSVVNLRSPRMGAARVRQELQQKGIAPDAIAEAVADLRDTELARAREVWGRRFDAPPTDSKERGRQMRFLMARGFAGSTISKVFRFDVEADADDDSVNHNL